MGNKLFTDGGWDDSDDDAPSASHTPQRVAPCPHVRELSYNRALKERITRFGAERLTLRCAASADGDPCDAACPFLVLCMHRDCDASPMCDARANGHADEHVGRRDPDSGEVEEHCITVNLASGLFWCRVCKRELTRADDSPVAGSNTATHKSNAALSPLRAVSEALSACNGGVRTGAKRVSGSGLCGLVNLGNTCYMNSVLQCLAHTPPFADSLLQCHAWYQRETLALLNRDPLLLRRMVKKEPPILLGNSLQNLFAAMMTGSPSNYVRPVSVLRNIQSIDSAFNGYRQQDAQELLRILLDRIQDECIRPHRRSRKEQERVPPPPPSHSYHFAPSLFRGQIKSTIRCSRCATESSMCEDFYDLSVPIPDRELLASINSADGSDGKGWMASVAKWSDWAGLTSPRVTLSNCLSAFSRSEAMEGEDQYQCDNCKRLTDSVKYISVSSLPRVLCVHLKRFRYDYFGSKISQRVDYPLAGLDMAPYCQVEDDTVPSYLYDLVGVVQHRGGLGGGHYIACCRHGSSGEWFEFNDSFVSEVSEEYVRGLEAYLLFYSLRHDASDTEERIAVGRIVEKLQKSIGAGHGRHVVFIPSLWYQNWLAAHDPGELKCSGLLCKHGKIDIGLAMNIDQLVVPITREKFQEFVSRYGGDADTVISSLEPCAQCDAEHRLLVVRRKEELRMIQKLDRQKKEPGEMWYIISAEWLAQWTVFATALERDTFTMPPGKIDNRSMLLDTNDADEMDVEEVGAETGEVSEKKTACSDATHDSTSDAMDMEESSGEENDVVATPSSLLRPNLRKVKDYKCIVLEVWEYFVSVYGGGPAIIRPHTNIYLK